MDDERPIDQFFGFLKLVAALFIIILSGLGLVVGLIWYLSPEPMEEVRQLTGQSVKRLPAYAPTDPAPSDPMPLELAAAEAAYREAKGELEAVLEQHDGTPEPIRAELGVVEQAIVDVVSALALNPDNEFLQRTLIGTYQRQIDLLRTSVEIAREPAAEELAPISD